MSGFDQIEMCADHNLRLSLAWQGANQIRSLHPADQLLRKLVSGAVGFLKDPPQGGLAFAVLDGVSAEALLYHGFRDSRELDARPCLPTGRQGLRHRNPCQSGDQNQSTRIPHRTPARHKVQYY
jgi:hypothetical protein